MRIATQETFRDPKVVSSYARAEYIEPAERTLLELLQQKMPHPRILDIAVGAGRTTSYFAPIASEYVGIDYSPEMIEACHKRFGSRFSNARFSVLDMRTLDSFEDNSFDFILISYNAISALQHEERLHVFKEMSRICSDEGQLYFSAHNSQGLHRLFSFSALLKDISFLHPQITYWNIRKWFLRRIKNPLLTYSRSLHSRYAMINDGAEDFRLCMYYVKPSEQVSQLSSYFNKVQVFSAEGLEITSQDKLLKADDPWLFYLATDHKYN